MLTRDITCSAERSDIGFELPINDDLLVPSHVDEGMRVVAPYVKEDGGLYGLRCVVLVAAGTHARVGNVKRGYERWFHVSELRVEASSAS